MLYLPVIICHNVFVDYILPDKYGAKSIIINWMIIKGQVKDKNPKLYGRLFIKTESLLFFFLLSPS